MLLGGGWVAGCAPGGDGGGEGPVDGAAGDAGGGDVGVETDEGVVDPDEGVVAADEGVVAPDEGVVAPDEGVVAPDEGVTAPDEGVAPDMAPPDMAPPDMASPDPDADTPEPDMAPPEPDADLPEPDMAPPEPDAALPPACPVGQHRCGEACAPNDAAASCGDRCEPCPGAANGRAVCVAGACAVACEAGFEACAGGCCPIDDCALVDLGGALGAEVWRVDTTGRPNDFGASCQGRTGADAAARWVAPRAARYTFSIERAAHDTVLTLRADCEGPELACDDDGGEGLRSRIVRAFAAGEAAVVVVDGFNAAAGVVPLGITADEAGFCEDAVDNDGDGRVDCADPDCAAECPVVSERGLCGGGVDDDGDGLVDCADPDCADDALCLPAVEGDCDDGLDADRDGDVDCADEDCADDPACRVAAEANCGDGRDDDGDGLVDCRDPDCARAAACLPAHEFGRCADGVDDDGDFRVDCADSDCEGDLACRPDPCRAPGACADPACVGDPVCCADVDLGGAVGLDVGAGRNDVAHDLSGTCGGLEARERTFAWTAPKAGLWLFDVSNAYSRDNRQPTLDATLYLLRGCDGASLVCNSDVVVGARGGRVRARLAAGETVLVVVDGNGFNAGGTFLLSVVPGDDGDAVSCGDANGDGERDCGAECDAACDCIGRDIGLVVEPLVLRSTTARTGADRRGSCGGAGEEEVVRWVAPETATYTFRLEPAAANDPLDPVLYILDGACDARELGCNDDAGPGDRGAVITRRATAGEALLLVLDSAGASGSYLLSITTPNELGRCADGRDQDGDFDFDCDDADCAGAPNCACPHHDAGDGVGPAVARGRTSGRGNLFRLSCGFDRMQDTSLTWTAPADGEYTFALDADFDYLLGVLDGGCAGEELACRANAAVTLALAAGQAVTLVVDGAQGNGNYAGSFALNVWAASEAGRCDDGVDSDGDRAVDCDDADCAEDDACSGYCLGADLGDALGDGVWVGDLMGATNDYRPRCLDWTRVDGIDQGFAWTAPYAGRFQFDTFGSAARTSLAILDGSCYGDELACNYWAPTRRQSRTQADLAAGQTVVIVVDIAQQNPDSTAAQINIHPTEFGRCADGLDNDGDGLGDCEDPDCGRDRICLAGCADVDLGQATGERVLVMRSDRATNDFETACTPAAANHDEVAVLWTAPQSRTWRVTTAWSDVRTSLAVMESCQGPELQCRVDSPWSANYSGFSISADAGDAMLFLVEIRQLGEGEFTLNIE
ncbi:MAG: hypothetical protein H6701_13095 [Myxococcales bacterium]|nr:hypothetical protein [Myxococcales bacterium]